MARKGGLGPNRGTSNVDYREDASFPWDVSESTLEKSAQRAKEFETQDVDSLVDLWPSRDNYYKGPENSTRLTRHTFVSKGGVEALADLGTVYILFEGTRKNGNKKGPDVYKYENVPAPVYREFARSNSKGRFVTKRLDSYGPVKLGGADAFPS